MGVRTGLAGPSHQHCTLAIASAPALSIEIASRNGARLLLLEGHTQLTLEIKTVGHPGFDVSLDVTRTTLDVKGLLGIVETTHSQPIA